jgi:hypothetical protein
MANSCGNEFDCIMAAFCSWNLVPSRSDAFNDLSTQRLTRVSSLEPSDFELKSLMQSSKHF